jgi:hypothetical protein
MSDWIVAAVIAGAAFVSYHFVAVFRSLDD